MSREAMISPISEWLIAQSLDETDVVELFDGMCKKMIGVGIPINRARLIWPTLHPLFQAETVVWDIGKESYLDQFAHQDNESDAWKRSTLKYFLDNNLDIMRRELQGPNELVDFEMLQDLKDEGVTDYVVLGTELRGASFKFNEGMRNQRVLITWASDRPGGFSADDLWALQKIHKRFAVTCKVMIQSRIADNIATTYLGKRAGERVRNGQIRRGDGEETTAIVWYSDLRNSTSLAETMKPDKYFSLLNSYFMSTAQPVVEHGGEILDFIGDAVLGIFPFEGEGQKKQAAEAACDAIRSALEYAKTCNEERIEAGMEKFNFGIGINEGSVRFGNIGIPTRLAFSVIGPTVNEVARIETMTKSLQQPVLAGEKFARLLPDKWKTVGKHKLEGVLEPVELFMPNYP